MLRALRACNVSIALWTAKAIAERTASNRSWIIRDSITNRKFVIPKDLDNWTAYATLKIFEQIFSELNLKAVNGNS